MPYKFLRETCSKIFNKFRTMIYKKINALMEIISTNENLFCSTLFYKRTCIQTVLRSCLPYFQNTTCTIFIGVCIKNVLFFHTSKKYVTDCD